MTDWQKIESAPEGIKLDVWVWNVVEGGLDDGFRWPEVQVIGGGVPHGLLVYRGDPDFGGEWEEYWPHENGQVVTHWARLPDPPVA